MGLSRWTCYSGAGSPASRSESRSRNIAAILVRESLFKSEELWEHEQDQDYVDIEPGGFALAQTLETVTMPNDLMGLVEGRSSLARVGLSVHLTAPKIDPGFGGMIALEIANAGPATVRLESQKDWPEG